jgi:hypothetical protein
MDFWQNTWSSTLGGVIGSAVGVAVAIWIMRRTMRHEKTLAAEGAKEERRRFDEQLAHQRDLLQQQIAADRAVVQDERLINAVVKYLGDWFARPK